MFKYLIYAKLGLGMISSIVVEMVRLAFNAESLDSVHDVFYDEED